MNNESLLTKTVVKTSLNFIEKHYYPIIIFFLICTLCHKMFTSIVDENIYNENLRVRIEFNVINKKLKDEIIIMSSEIKELKSMVKQLTFFQKS